MVLIFNIPWSVLTRFFNLFASTFCFFYVAQIGGVFSYLGFLCSVRLLTW